MARKKAVKKVAKKRAKRSNCASRTAKKSAKRTRDVLVVASKVKGYIKSKKMNTSAQAISSLSDQIYEMLDAAAARTKANGETTIAHITAGPIDEQGRPAGATGSKSSPKQLEVPKIPVIFQQRLDELIEESKHRELSQAEQSALDELLDYLDDQTAYELEKIISTQTS